MSGEDEKPRSGDAEAVTEPERAPSEDVARLTKELEAASARAADLLDRLRRSQADYENLQKRTAREMEDARATANEALLAALLPVLDDFDHALASLQGEAAEGVRMVHGNLWRTLREAGLEAIDPAGKAFDPYDHEVVGQANDEETEDGTVREVVQKGYRYRRRLLRPAKVIVVKRGE